MPHKYINAFILIFIFLLADYTSVAQEICNNGIDDDSDNLVDLHDPDCQCQFRVTGNLLLNGSFESYDHCPVTYMYENDHNISGYWEYGTYTNVSEANFYHNLKCGYDSMQVMLRMPPVLPLPDGKAFVSILNSAYLHAIPEKDMTKSYVGQCLQNPLKKGEEYTLSFYAGRFRSWDNFTGKIFPFTVAVFGNADCKAVPFGKVNAPGNGCPSNYPGWVLLGKTVVHSNGQWIQDKINFTIPYEINVIEIGTDCSILPPVIDLTDSTTYFDYHVYYLDDLHLLPTKDFPFEYIHAQTASACNGFPVLEAPVIANATYQWYKDSIVIEGATKNTYQVTEITGRSYYNALISTNEKCIISEPFLVTTSRLSELHIPPDTVLCNNSTLLLAPSLDGITYDINGTTNFDVTINKEGNYAITATDANGCQRMFNTKVIEQNCSECEPYIPNAFTPNGDGLNDIFKPKFLCTLSQFNFKILNRWGEKIFESRDVNKGWDGTYSGNKTPGGVYVYVIDYKTASGQSKTVKGTLALIR